MFFYRISWNSCTMQVPTLLLKGKHRKRKVYTKMIFQPCTTRHLLIVGSNEKADYMSFNIRLNDRLQTPLELSLYTASVMDIKVKFDSKH